MLNIDLQIQIDNLDSDQPKNDNWDGYEDFSDETNRCISVIDDRLNMINLSISYNNDESLDSQELILDHFLHLLNEGINNNKKSAIAILFWYINNYNCINYSKLNIRTILTLLFKNVAEFRNTTLILRILNCIFKFCPDILNKSIFYYIFNDEFKTPLEIIDLNIDYFYSKNKEKYEELKNIKSILNFFIEETNKILI
jgi:hypothetical protein